MDKIEYPKNKSGKAVSQLNIFSASLAIKKITESVGSRYDIGAYFQPWVNFCYYILLLPFKIKYNDEKYYIVTNQVQQVLCGILHPIICINSIITARAMVAVKVRQNPTGLIHGIRNASLCFVVFMFFYTVWFRRDSILTICNHFKPRQNDDRVRNKVIYFCTFLFILAHLNIFLYIFAFNLTSLDSDKAIRDLTKTFRLVFHLSRTELENADTEELTMWLKLTASSAHIPEFITWTFMDFIYLGNIMTALVGYKMATNFKGILMKSIAASLSGSVGSTLSTREVFDSYLEVKMIFRKLNDFNGPVLAGSFLFLATYCPVNIVNVLDSDRWEYQIIQTFYIVYLFMWSWFSAEAYCQGRYFRTWLLSCRNVSLTDKIDYLLEAEECNIAIKGDPFFTITYGFLGTTASVLLTYTIILIQFGGGRIHNQYTFS